MKELTITDKQFVKAIDYCAEKLLDPKQFGGPWFGGDENELDNWMGDVFIEAVEYFLEGLGVKLKWEEDDE